jgi:signal transduction histidine kinase
MDDPTRDPILELVDAERARAEALLNYVRGLVLVVLAAAAVAYAPRISRELKILNFSVIVPLMLWTIAQHVLTRRNPQSMRWLSFANPILDTTAVSAILLGYGILGSPVLAVKTPLFGAYFAILAARPITSSTRIAAFTTVLATLQYLAIVLYVILLGGMPVTSDPVASVSSPAISYLDQGARLLLLAIMGAITTYATAWHERLLRRAMEAQVQRAAEERALSQSLQETDKLSALGTLAASVAHEVCSPLTSIAMLADMMKMSAEQPEIREDASTIAQEARRTEVVIRDLLQVARPRSPESVPISLEDVVRRSLSLLRLLIRDQNIRIDTAFDANAPDFMGDASRLEQVTLNLIINAVHALEGSTREKVIRLEIRYGREGHHLIIEDNGPGIPAHVASRIFERFFTTKQVGKGTGLGLWIVRQIIEEHGGTIRAENSRGGGARFEIILPRGAQRIQTGEYGLIAG